MQKSDPSSFLFNPKDNLRPRSIYLPSKNSDPEKRIMRYLNAPVSVSRSLELFPFEGLSIIPVFRGDVVRCHS